MDLDFKDIKFKKKNEKHNNNINIDINNTNGILIAILHELKDINRTLTKHDYAINHLDRRVTKIEEKEGI